jgi:hypothetical protein
MQGRKLRIDRVVGAVVVVGLIAGGSWWAIAGNGEGEEDSPKPTLSEEVVTSEPKLTLTEIEKLGREVTYLGGQVSSLKKSVEEGLSSIQGESVLEEPVSAPAEVQEEENAAAALGRMLYDSAKFCTLIIPKLQDTIVNVGYAFSEGLAVPQEITSPPPPSEKEEKGFFSELLGPLGGEKESEKGNFIAQICGTCTQTCTAVPRACL